MLRISEKELRSLRNRAKTGGQNAAAASGKKKKGKIPRAPREAPPPDLPELEVMIDLAPQVKQRARTFAQKHVMENAFGAARGDFSAFSQVLTRGGGLMRSVTPEATKAFEAAVATIATSAMSRQGLKPFPCPVDMEIVFRFEGDPMTWPTAPADGDIDNLAKAVKDAINKIAYVDDRLVVRSQLCKECAEAASIIVRVRAAAP